MTLSALAQDNTIVQYYPAKARYTFDLSLPGFALSKLDQNHELSSPYKDIKYQGLMKPGGGVDIILDTLDLEFKSTKI